MNDPRGSIWRKWDIHVHTPESYHQEYGDDWNRFVDELRNKAVEHDIEVAVINDYFSIDGYARLVDSYCEEKYPSPSLALPNGKKLYMLPGIELRLSIFDHDEDSVNLHIVFDAHYLPENIRSGFIEKLAVKYGEQKLNCKKDDLTKIGHAIQNGGRYNENLDIKRLNGPEVIQLQKKAYSLITLDIDDIDEGLKRLEESLANFEQRFYLKIIAYKGHGSLAGFDWYTVQGQEGRAGNNKRILLNKSDICFSNNISDRAFLLGMEPKTPYQEVIDRFRTLKPCVWGSDAHSLENLFHPSNGGTTDYTWIKSDPTFEGLRQILYEPDSRVFIGIVPNKLINVDETKQLFVDTISVASTQDDAEWFDKIKTIPLNPGLVSIIGNKGAGKSALADIIASAGNCKNDSYSFLSIDRFLKLDQRIKYTSSITFLDGTAEQKPFQQADYDPDKPSKVVYLSQSFVRDLCESEDISKLQKEIYRVLGSHIPDEEKGEFDNLDDIIDQRTTIFNDMLTTLVEKLHKINDDIVKHESYGNPLFRLSKQNKLEERRKELGTLDAQFKKIPVVTALKKDDNKAIVDEVTKLRKEIGEFHIKGKNIQESLNLLASEIQQVQSLIAEIDLQVSKHSELIQRLTSDPLLVKYGVIPKDLFVLNVNIDPLKQLLDKLNADILSMRRQKEESDKSIVAITKLIKEKESLLGIREKGYQEYQAKLHQWEERKKAIEGDSKTPDTIKNLEAWLTYIDNSLATKIHELLTSRTDLVHQIVGILQNKKGAFDNLFSYGKSEAISIAEKANLPAAELLHFQINLRFNSKFDEMFLDMISHSKAGTFYGKENGLKELKRLKNSLDLNDASSISDFPYTIINALKYDLKKPEAERQLESIEEQLTEGYELTDLYNFLFSLNYVEIAVEIEHRGRRLENLSPGEKGTVLLIFYLLLDKDRRPLIIDQPEENLDNETIFLVLVPLIKQAKEERQIIVVTHNPNLAVVCDSEQIIHASMNKEDRNLVAYALGSIEKSDIRDDTIKILEGTKRAFANRQSKYRLIGKS
jgi:hypothetical protein